MQRPRMEKLTIVRALPGISRLLEVLEIIYGHFPSADRIDCLVKVPNLGKVIYRESKKLTEFNRMAVNRLKDHTGGKKHSARVR